MEVLSEIRVVEFATEIAGPYCGKLFADAGADVVKVEPESGDLLRRRAVNDEELGPKDAALFRFLNAGKRSIVGDPDDDEISELIGSADVVLESFVPARLDVDALRNQFPHLVILSTTPYGRGGSWETRPTTEFIVQAESGGTGGRGEPDQPPVYAGGRLSEWIMGAYAGVAALAAVIHAEEDGPWRVHRLLAARSHHAHVHDDHVQRADLEDDRKRAHRSGAARRTAVDRADGRRVGWVQYQHATDVRELPAYDRTP